MEIDHQGSSSSSSWRRLQRSNSLLLESELAADSSGFNGKVSGYQRLSQSMRVSSDPISRGFLCKPTNLRKRRANNWTEMLGKLFSCNKIRAKPREVDLVAKKKKGSSWLPDPDRRWPVQGW